ncbi:hypothetical protein ABPG75_007348 [Micractinium tetrahymenae]
MVDVAAWSREDVCVFLERLGLPQELQDAFRKNAVDGADVVGLSDADLVGELGCTQLQARKIRSHLTQLGVPPPAGVAPSAADPNAEAQALQEQQQEHQQAAAAERSAEPDPRSCFQPADLERYQHLTQAATALEGLQPAAHATQASAHLKHVKERLGAAEAVLPPLQKALHKENKRILKYSGQKFSLTGLLTTKRHKEAKLGESEAKAQQLAQQVETCEAGIAARQSELAEAQRQLAAWQGTVAELSSTRQQLTGHVESMFAAPAWRASPRHAELADALAATSAQAAEAGRGVDTYGRGAKLLGDAGRLLQDAEQNLAQTQMFTMFDMGMDLGFGGGYGYVPGHLFDDLVEMALIEQANGDVRMAAQKALEARTLLPGLPTIDEHVLGAAKIGLFQNFLFGGGIGSDLIELALVARSKREVELLQQQVAAAAGWAQSNVAVYRQQDAALRAQAAAKKGELDAFRRAALQAALAAGS